MLNTITTIISGMTTTIEITTSFDACPKSRLKQMRMQKESDQSLIRIHHDNCLRAQMQAAICMNRIKQANKIGLYYWHHGRDELVNGYRTVESYERKQTAETVYLEMLKQDPQLGGSFEMTPYGMGSELSCLSTFVAASIKDRMVGRYVLYQSQSQAPRTLGNPSTELLALPDKESESYRQKYATQQEQYANRLLEQSPYTECANLRRDILPALCCDATPPEIEGESLIADQPMKKKPRTRKTNTSQKRVSKTALCETNLEDIKFGEVEELVTKSRHTIAAEKAAKKELEKAERAAQKLAKAAERASQKAAEKASQKAAEKAAKELAEAAERATQKTSEKTSKRKAKNSASGRPVLTLVTI